MKIYARYKYTKDFTAKIVGNAWHEVTKEEMRNYPSGRRNTVVINGVAVKADYCEIVQVF